MKKRRKFRLNKERNETLEKEKAKAAEEEMIEEAAEETGNEDDTPDEAAGEAAPEKSAAEEELAKVKEQLMRNMAEYDNYRKRTAKEKSEMMPEMTARVVTEFLPVLDNLERALAADCSDEGYKKGVQMIYDSFLAALDKLGVEKVPTDSFDPSMHQAVQQVASDDHESGQIVSVFQNGYRIGTKVIRFAMVSVAQ